MKKFISIVLALVVVALSFSTSVYAENDKIYKIDVEVEFMQTEARKMLGLINDFRTGNEAWYWNSSNTSKIYENNLKALTYDYELEQIAMQRVVEIAINFSHTKPNGGSCFDGYPDHGAAGENIAYGYTNVNSMFTGFREENEPYNGQGHRRNMLSKNFTSVAVAACKYKNTIFWVEEFRDCKDAQTPTPAIDALKTSTIEISSNTISAVKPNLKATDITGFAGTTLDYSSISAEIGSLTFDVNNWSRSITSKDFVWKSNNTDIVKIENNKLVLLKQGKATVTTDFLGETITLNVAVTAQKGDTNSDGKIDSTDALNVLQYAVGLINIEKINQSLYDVDENGSINSSDALLILQYSINLIPTL